jgi:hypothetical protein
MIPSSFYLYKLPFVEYDFEFFFSRIILNFLKNQGGVLHDRISLKKGVIVLLEKIK